MSGLRCASSVRVSLCTFARAAQLARPLSTVLHARWQSSAPDAATPLGKRLPRNIVLDDTAYSMVRARELDATVASTRAAPVPAASTVIQLPVWGSESGVAVPSAVWARTSTRTRVSESDARPDVVHRVVVWQDANARTTLYKTKDRREVSGGGRKPWRQKGTGRARHGSIRSPLWRGGGAAHGPLLRSWRIGLPHTHVAAGVAVALSYARERGRVLVVDSLPVLSKTREAVSWLQERVGASSHAVVCGSDAEVTAAAPGTAVDLRICTRNLHKVFVLPERALNVRQIVGARHVIITRAALDGLHARLAQRLRFSLPAVSTATSSAASTA